VSVIVPTRNSGRTIEACLASIRAQTYRDVELVVVDNNSVDGTLEIARRFADRVMVRGPERSAQRNAGGRAATGEFLVFVDGDMLVSAEVAAEVAQEFGRQPALQSLIVPLRSVGENFWARCRALEKDLYIGDPDMEAARAFRHVAFDGVGGYDEALHAGEDWDLSARVSETGGAIGRILAELIHDEGWVGLRELLLKKRYYGGTLALYVRKHPGLATRQIVRVAFVRNARILLRAPLLGLGLVLMKLLEFAAAVVGAALPWPDDRLSKSSSHSDEPIQGEQ
jgi:glycosyltransferase involved in cell wall biosynthesis